MARRVIDAGFPVVEVNTGGGLAAVMRQGQSHWISTPTPACWPSTSGRSA